MKHLIFDYNGPIIDGRNFDENRSKRIAKIFESEWTLQFQEMWKKHYLEVSSGKINIKEYYEKIAESLDKKLTGNEDRRFLQEERLADENVPAYLKELKEDYGPEMRIGLLSNYVQHWVTRTLDYYDIRKYFDVIVVSDRMKLRKPDLRMYRLTANVMGVPAYDCGYVGDTFKDIDAARQTAMKPFFIPGEETEPREYPKYPKIDNIGEVENFLYYEKPQLTRFQRFLRWIG